MNTKTELTLTSYLCTYPSGSSHRTTTAPEASWVEQTRLHVTTVTDTYRVGDIVQVAAFGRWRKGVVTKLNRSKVEVDYVTNREGTNRRVKAFPASEIRPWSARTIINS